LQKPFVFLKLIETNIVFYFKCNEETLDYTIRNAL